MQIKFAVQHELCDKVCFVWGFCVVWFCGFFENKQNPQLIPCGFIEHLPAKYLRKFFFFFEHLLGISI